MLLFYYNIYFCFLLYLQSFSHFGQFLLMMQNLEPELSSEAATETIFENICSFFPGAPFFWSFPGGFMCSPNRCQFSRKVCLFTEQLPIFQEGFSVHRTDTNFSGECGLFTEQIPFFQKPSLCVHRTDTNFPELLF